MLVVKTRIGPSPIHGIGCFALQDIAAGALVWRPDPKIDRLMTDAEMKERRSDIRDHLYRNMVTGLWVYSADNAYYLNHARPATLRYEIDDNGDERYTAARAIAAGEELTLDYAEMDQAEPDFTYPAGISALKTE